MESNFEQEDMDNLSKENAIDLVRKRLVADMNTGDRFVL